MNLELASKNFLGIENNAIDQSDIVIVPFGLEKSVSFGGGTAQGPKRIIEVSPELEFFDEELRKETYKEIKFCLLQEPAIRDDAQEAINQLEEIAAEIFALNKFPLILGGEHTVTIGPVKAALKKYGQISILHFDAHSDLRNSLEGNKLSHGAVMRRCFEPGGVNLTQVGIRNISNEPSEGGEYDFVMANSARIKTFWARDRRKWNLDEIVDSLGENVYLSFDVDVFDSSLMPSTGTPEPGGLDWYLVNDILKIAFARKNVIGADFVELAPIANFHAPDFVAAKLVYKCIGYKLAGGR